MGNIAWSLIIWTAVTFVVMVGLVVGVAIWLARRVRGRTRTGAPRA